MKMHSFYIGEISNMGDMGDLSDMRAVLNVTLGELAAYTYSNKDYLERLIFCIAKI